MNRMLIAVFILVIDGCLLIVATAHQKHTFPSISSLLMRKRLPGFVDVLGVQKVWIMKNVKICYIFMVKKGHKNVVCGEILNLSVFVGNK